MTAGFPVAVFWSGGKDSALALARLQRDPTYRVVALITTINRDFQRVSMHGVREALIDAQADAIGLPLDKMYVASAGTNDEYIAALREKLASYQARGVAHVAFGDIFLEDLRQWRETLLRESGMSGVFPLWKEDTRRLAGAFVAQGFKAVTCCINDPQLSRDHVGRPLDQAFFDSLPNGVDLCGENGEYHTFVYDGPIFKHPVRFTNGDIVYRPIQPPAADKTNEKSTGPRISVPSTSAPGSTKGFWFADFLPADNVP